MNTDKIRAHIRKLVKDGELNGEIIEICDGDRYNSEQGEDIKFVIDNKKYSIGYSYITEDDDDWAQAECYEVNWCRCDGKHMDSKVLYVIVENRKSLERESKLKSIGI
jgi:hypothetical protein